MLLNLQRVVIALVNNMAIAENIAYQTINPGVAAGHFGQQRLNDSQTLRDVFRKASQIARTTRNLHQVLRVKSSR